MLSGQALEVQWDIIKYIFFNKHLSNSSFSFCLFPLKVDLLKLHVYLNIIFVWTGSLAIVRSNHALSASV